MSVNKWQVGTKAPINVYDGENPVCQCQTVEYAQEIVAAVNSKNEQREICLCAAIKMPDGEVVRGHRHNNCYDVVRYRAQFISKTDTAKAEVYRIEIVRAISGFVTSAGRFVDRYEGMSLMRASGLRSWYRSDGEYIGNVLFSEDLYPDGPIKS